MVIKYHFFILIFTFFGQYATAQKLFLRPSVGLQFPMNHIIKPPNDKYFSYNTFHFYPDFGLNLQLDINKKYSILAGWNNGGTGYSFSFRHTNGMISLKHATVVATQRFNIAFQKNIRTVKWMKIKRRLDILKEHQPKNSDILYFLLFRLRLIAGASADYLVRSSGERVPNGYIGQYVEWMSIDDRDNNRWGASIFLGLNLQFFNYEKDNIQLLLFYSQGIDRKFSIDLNYKRIDGSEYYTKLGTRGSHLGILLGYPIKIKEFKSKADSPHL